METKQKTQAVAKTEATPSVLLELAVQNNLDVEKLEKLMQLQERWEAKEAEKAFNSAMANFQKECPEIKKGTPVKDKSGKVRYHFANIGFITGIIKKPLAENDLFYDFDTEIEGEFMKIICTLTHKAGHSKNSHFKIPIGKEEYMTDVQKYGARDTFAKRYALCNACGITTADQDNDANIKPEKPGLPELTPEHPKWEGAKKAIKNGTVKLDAIKKKYTVSAENEALLAKELIPKEVVIPKEVEKQINENK